MFKCILLNSCVNYTYFQNGCKGTKYLIPIKIKSMNASILSFFIGGLRSALPLATEGTQEQASVFLLIRN